MCKEQTYRLEIRFDFTGTEEEAIKQAYRIAGKLDGGMVTGIVDEEWNDVLF